VAATSIAGRARSSSRRATAGVDLTVDGESPRVGVDHRDVVVDQQIVEPDRVIGYANASSGIP
jgi:hypothetical protein